MVFHGFEECPGFDAFFEPVKVQRMVVLVAGLPRGGDVYSAGKDFAGAGAGEGFE